VSGELIATIVTLIVLGITLIIPGGRVLVLPVIFTLILVLLYWAAKPKARKSEE
jgi:membrane protein implicated in regulation of membrane protease activity